MDEADIQQDSGRYLQEYVQSECSIQFLRGRLSDWALF